MTPDTPTWQTLLAAAQANNPQPHNRFAQLATVQGSHEPRPMVRTVAMRFFLDDARLLISTDMRSEKVGELAANPACELCWYFTESREQFRLSGRAIVIGAAQAALEAKLADAMQRTWAQRSSSARQSYTWPQPKRRLDDAVLFTRDEPMQIPAHFALLLLEIQSVDYLNIAQNPHQRVAFSKLGGQWMPRVINP